MDQPTVSDEIQEDSAATFTIDDLARLHFKLGQFRKYFDKSQRETAREIGVNNSTICRFEKTGRNITIETVVKILRWMTEMERKAL